MKNSKHRTKVEMKEKGPFRPLPLETPNLREELEELLQTRLKKKKSLLRDVTLQRRTNCRMSFAFFGERTSQRTSAMEKASVRLVDSALSAL